MAVSWEHSMAVSWLLIGANEPLPKKCIKNQADNICWSGAGQTVSTNSTAPAWPVASGGWPPVSAVLSAVLHDSA